MFVRPINQAQPVNWDHPLNQGKFAWWLTVPHLSGGLSIPELIAGRNGSVSGSWISSGSTSGGMPLAVYTAINKPSSLPSLGFTAPPITILQWVNQATAYPSSGYPATIAEANGRGAIFAGGNAGGALRYQWNGTADEYSASSGIFLTVGAWQLVALVVTASFATLYHIYRGVLSSWTNTKTHNSYTMGTFTIGGDRSIGDHYNDCYCDDLSIYTRALSSSEIIAAYEDRLSGYAGTLNGLASPASLFPASPPAGGPFPWYLDQSAMSGGLQTMGI